jgi:protein-disulfide isomerase
MTRTPSRRSVLAGLAVATVLASGRSARAADPTYPMDVRPDDMVMGNADAPITIIEYASLTCDHCVRFHRDTLPQLKKNWIDTGKARLVYRDYPLDRVALRAAMLPHCAGPERYFAFLGAIFQQHDQWAHAQDPMGSLTRLMRFGGMSEDQVKACVANPTLETKVLGSRMDAERRYEVKSTPTFIVNGRKLTGALPYAEFDAILSGAK